MRQHTAIGERILNAAPALQPVARLVRASHERWDGGGYPDGLAGDAIPLGRADHRRLRRLRRDDLRPLLPAARSRRDALAELRRCAGTQFDPEVIDALCARLDPSALRDGESAQGADDPAVLAYRLHPVLTGLAAEPAVHRHAEV